MTYNKIAQIKGFDEKEMIDIAPLKIRWRDFGVLFDVPKKPAEYKTKISSIEELVVASIRSDISLGSFYFTPFIIGWMEDFYDHVNMDHLFEIMRDEPNTNKIIAIYVVTESGFVKKDQGTKISEGLDRLRAGLKPISLDEFKEIRAITSHLKRDEDPFLKAYGLSCPKIVRAPQKKYADRQIIEKKLQEIG